MRKSLIISRFNENIGWLEEIKGFKIIIYNKGKKLSNKKYKKIINLNNVGRESHTWLFHIVENYENLDDVNILVDRGIIDYKNDKIEVFGNFYLYQDLKQN